MDIAHSPRLLRFLRCSAVKLIGSAGAKMEAAWYTRWLVSESPSTPQINASKMPVGGGIAGALVVISTMLIFLVGIPAMRYFLIGAIVLGCAVAAIIHFARRFFPPKPPETLSVLSIRKD